VLRRLMRVLFLCTGNSARSQMAEALLRRLSRGAVDAFSAGTAPAREVHPMARSTLRERYGIDDATLRPKAVDEFAGQTFDAVITVCDAAAAACPTWPGARRSMHWSFADPAAVADDEAQRRAFADVASGLHARISEWLETIAPPRPTDRDARARR
jgi:protein-tyrosine-phosphatase